MDVETTTTNKGNVNTVVNKLVTIQYKEANGTPVVLFKEDFHKAKEALNRHSCIVGWNLKFDLAWLEKELGFKARSVWDCQLAEFIMSRQTWKYPALEDGCVKYKVGHKLDIVKTEYWDKGIDTDEIPRDILAEYGAQDCNVTYEIFLKQLELFKTTHEHMFRLFRVHCNDLLVLQEMEFNGICYDTEGSLAQSAELSSSITKIEANLHEFTENIPINWDSNDDVSVFLYGGTIKTETRVPIGVYKSGAKLGQVRNKVVHNEYKVQRKVEPLKNSELKKEGYFSTDEATLRSLQTNKVTKFIINKLLDRSKLVKLKSTYLEGLPKTITKFGWPNNMLYSVLNQCLAITGRLSSSKPNQQNLPKEAKKYCISRYQ